MKFAVIQFPGSNCDLDALHILIDVLKLDAELVWHKEFEGKKFDGAIIPGGFTFGDYWRTGLVASFSPAMDEVKRMNKEKLPIMGICNGFQILTEAQLLPGALIRNKSLNFICDWVKLRVETTNSAFSNKMKKGQVIKIPIAHGEGCYVNDEKGLKDLNENDQVIFRYCNEQGELTEDANPNGSVENIAGICNLERNIVGLMPHPERASEKILSPFKTDDGLLFFDSMLNYLSNLK
ncbi:MAG: phosphoribosylformylglycinamidine synthase I [Candidatus Lokiarchaeota archaeon]|nr:phosphoribosylformylglycinamidine synthase I [Candidatus Lokiarchaeota archaeon]